MALEELLSLIRKEVDPSRYEDAFFQRYIAFRFRAGDLEPVQHPSVPDPDDILGVDSQKEILFRNTAQFVKCLPANDALLWGDRGTGKSSLVKSLLKPFSEEGLRIVQIHKWEIPSLSDLYLILRGRRQRFILFFDDLSFEPREESFKLLKSLLDGDIEERPPNVIVYATSNRRHLVPEENSDEKFPSDSLHERVSLIDRFGIRLAFYPFDKETYLRIVEHYVRKRGIEFPPDKLKEEALRWATERGNFSGRTAYQFVKDLEGRISLSS